MKRETFSMFGFLIIFAAFELILLCCSPNNTGVQLYSPVGTWEADKLSDDLQTKLTLNIYEDKTFKLKGELIQVNSSIEIIRALGNWNSNEDILVLIPASCFQIDSNLVLVPVPCEKPESYKIHENKLVSTIEPNNYFTRK